MVFLSDNGTEFKNKAVDEYPAGIGGPSLDHADILPSGEPGGDGKWDVENTSDRIRRGIAHRVGSEIAGADILVEQLRARFDRCQPGSTQLWQAAAPPATARREQECEMLEQRERWTVDRWA